jgi:hypothetical protein
MRNYDGLARRGRLLWLQQVDGMLGIFMLNGYLLVLFPLFTLAEPKIYG